jgi:hypothetical protein
MVGAYAISNFIRSCKCADWVLLNCSMTLDQITGKVKDKGGLVV